MKKLLYLILSLTLLGIGGCDFLIGPDTPIGEGNLVIGFGEGGARFVLTEEVKASLRYELELTGPGGERIRASLSAGETFNRQVALGEWRIDADAFTPENSRIGEGTATVTVKTGTNQARVPMTVIAPEADTPVDAFDLTTLVTAPVKDAAPNTTAINETQYTGTITWQKGDGTSFSGNFAPSTVYKAVVSLTAQAGYTFTGVPANSFSYSGATTVSNAGNSGTVTITFPATAGENAAQGITLSFTDEGSGVFSETTFAVKQGGTSAEQSRDITVTGSWTSQEWRVDGFVKGNNPNFTVDAADYTVGGHTLQVTVKKGDGTSWSKTLPFTVTAAVTGVTLNKATLSLPVHGTETLYAAITPANAENRTVIWTSNDTAVATVTNGLVTGLSAGTAIITAKTYEGEYTATCTVTVGAAQAITLGFTDAGSGAFSETTFTVKQNGTPASQTINLTGSWTSQEWRVDGFVKDTSATAFTVNAADYTVGGHTLQVTVKKGDGTSWSKTLPFTVTAAVTGVSLNKTALSLLVGGTETLYAAVVPANAANRNVSWTSNNTTVATVNNGLVTAVTLGTATITVRTEDGNHTDTCTVAVGAAQPINLSFTDEGTGVFSQGTFTVKQDETPAGESQTITLVGTWASQEWRVDGFVKGNNPNFTINAADYTLGGHTLQVTVKNAVGTFWSKTLQFTVTN
jgi:uncharacterized protein YjdB